MRRVESSGFAAVLVLVLLAACATGYLAAASLRGLRLPSVRELAQSFFVPSPTLAVSAAVRLLVTPTTALATPQPFAIPTPTLRPVPTVLAPALGRPTAPATTSTSGWVPSESPPAEQAPGEEAKETPTVLPREVATAAPQYQYVPDGPPKPAPERGCYVGAVFGWVREESGQPLPGVQLRVSDPWGHNTPTMTKQPPDAGYYDVILGTGPAIYYVVVVDSLGNQLSPVVQVEHPEGASACWYEVSFRRVSAHRLAP